MKKDVDMQFVRRILLDKSGNVWCLQTLYCWSVIISLWFCLCCMFDCQIKCRWTLLKWNSDCSSIIAVTRRNEGSVVICSQTYWISLCAYSRSMKFTVVVSFSIQLGNSNQWVSTDNMFAFGSRSNPALTVGACKNACLVTANCTGIDWDPSGGSGSRCWFTGPWITSRGRRTGVTHYDLDCSLCAGLFEKSFVLPIPSSRVYSQNVISAPMPPKRVVRKWSMRMRWSIYSELVLEKIFDDAYTQRIYFMI